MGLMLVMLTWVCESGKRGTRQSRRGESSLDGSPGLPTRRAPAKFSESNPPFYSGTDALKIGGTRTKSSGVHGALTVPGIRYDSRGSQPTTLFSSFGRLHFLATPSEPQFPNHPPWLW